MEQLTRALPPPFILAAAVVAGIFGLLALRRSGALPIAQRRLHALGMAGLAGGAAFTALITLTNVTPTYEASSGLATSFTLATPAQTAVNLALFWWVGIFLPLVRRVRWIGVVAVIAVAAAATELVQMLLPWRAADIMDVVLNLAGGAVIAAAGIWLARAARSATSAASSS